MQDDSEVETPDYGEEEEFSTSSNIPKFIMKDAVLKDFITDPHQHLMYEYDFLAPKIFYLELLKTLPAKEIEGFPRCTLSVGALPAPNELTQSPNPEDDFLNDFLDEVDEDDFDDGFSEEMWEEGPSEFDTF
jgi:hypothetical protein